MSEERFTLVFDGIALESHEIDVKDLGQALIAMGDLIQAANTEINGDKTQVDVKVKAHKAGSFEVDFLVQSLEQLMPLLDFTETNKEKISAANELLDLIFKIVGAAATSIATIGGGLFMLLKFLKGKKPDKIEHQINGDVHVHIGDKYFLTNAKTIKLAESAAVRKPAKEIVSTLSHGGIDVMKIKRPSKADLEVTKGEVGYFDYHEDEEEVAETTRKMNLQIVKLSFKDDKWQMTAGDKPFSATIEDVDFLNKVKKSEVSFANGDYLECDVRENQYRTASGLKMKYAITKVNNHTSVAQQLRLI